MAENESLESPSGGTSSGVSSVGSGAGEAVGSARLRPAVVLLVVVVVVVAALRFAALERTLPYARHTDETFLSESAHAIVQTGDWNPHFFRYPSLPIYLTAAGIAVGTLREAGAGRAIDVADLHIATRGRPYRPVQPMRTARQLYVLMGLAALVFSGILAFRLTDRAALLWLAPLVLALPAGFVRSGWEYLNVDILATMWSAATLAFVIAHWHDDSAFARSLGPGVLVGLAVASKYTAGILVLSCLLAIWLAPGRHRLRHAALFLLLAAVAFLVCVPYALLDTPAFINGLAFEVRHYAVGHTGHEGPSGWLQFAHYMGELRREFGWLNLAVAALGLAVLSLHRPRRTLVVASFGGLLLLHMSQQRVHFLRNLFPLYVGLSVFAAYGWLLVYERLAAFVGERMPALIGAKLLVAVSLVAPLWWSLPIDAIRWANLPRMDSRNRLVEWLQTQAPAATLLLPQRLPFAAAADLQVERYALTRRGLANALAASDERLVVIPRLSGRVELPGGRAATQQWREAVAELVQRRGLEAALRLDGAPFEVLGDSRPLNPAMDVYRVGRIDRRTPR